MHARLPRMHAHARHQPAGSRAVLARVGPSSSDVFTVIPAAPPAGLLTAPRPCLHPLLPCPAPACSFRQGRQEDAHEFLIALLDALHEASIAGMQPKPPPELAQTSFVYRIFGGRMRSQVGGCVGWAGRGGRRVPRVRRTAASSSPSCLPSPWQACKAAGVPILNLSQSSSPPPPTHTHCFLQVKCSECGYESNTFDPCIDLSLEITRAASVRKALERFTAGGWVAAGGWVGGWVGGLDVLLPVH